MRRHAGLVISFQMTVDVDGDDELFEHWRVTGYVQDRGEDGEEPGTAVVAASFTIIDLDRFESSGRSVLAAADEEGGDLFRLAEIAFDGDALTEDIEEKLELPGAAALFLDHVRVDPAHRGAKLGLRVAAEAIATLSRGCSVVLTFPAPFEDGSPEPGSAEHTELVERLGRYWSQLGFTELRDGLFFIDPALVNPDLDRFRSR